MKAYNVPGLTKPLYIPDDIPFSVDIVPARVTNVRSNQPRSASVVTKMTDHETANFAAGATARMHRNWLHSGAGGSYVGFNAVADDREIIILTPFDEVTWAAGTPDGNLRSDHTERCVNDGINHSKARRNSAALQAAVIHARGLTVAAALVQHNVWYGKNCPLLLRRDGLWPWYVNQVQAAYGAIVAFVGGKPVDTGVKAGDTMLVTDRLNVRQGPGTGFPVVTTLDPDTTVTVGKDAEGNYQKSATGYTWLNIAYPGGSGWTAMDWLQKTTPPKPAPDAPSGWPYPKPIVPPFWDELMQDGATHVFSDGTLWLRSNDLYRVTKPTKRLRVVGGTESVGPDLKAGEEFRDAAKGQGYDGKAYVITPGLTRVLLDDLEFVTED